MREKWIDVWKGWLILLVVVGHVVGGGSHFAEGESRAFLRGVYFLIYSFHMPAFFFVAGWLWRRKEFGVFIKGRVKRLVVPYFIVGVISAVVYSLMHGGVVNGATDGYYVNSVGDAGGFIKSIFALIHAGGWPNGNGFRFNSVLWFLPCLFAVEVFYWAMESRFSSVRSSIAVAICLLIIGFSGMFCGRLDLPWGIGGLPRFMPWFIAGRIAKDKLANMRDMNVVGILVVAAIHAALVWLCWNVFTGMSKYWIGAASIAAGILLSYEIARLGARYATFARWMAVMGVSSMSIMLWHKFFVVAAQMKLSFVKAAYGGGVAMVTIVSAVITVLAIAVVLAGGRVYDRLARRMMDK